MEDRTTFVRGFRSSAPYIHAHRGRVFVVQFEGDALLEPGFPALVHDMALLHSLGVKLVIVHGIRPQIEELWPRQVVATWHGTERSYTWSNGSKVLLRSAERPGEPP